MSSKNFGEDPSEKQLNIGNLNKTFGISENRNDMEVQIKNMRDTLDEQSKELEKAENSEDRPDPDTFLYDNIDRANRLLDRLENQMNTGQLEARMFEVASQLINAITTASSSIVGANETDANLQYKYDWLELKHKELAVKQAMKEGGDKNQDGESNVTNNNLIVTSREDILNLIEQEKGGSSTSS